MLNLEFARLVEQDRRREIAAHLERERLLRPEHGASEEGSAPAAGRQSQRQGAAYRRVADPAR
jgi:hypothetical protein